MCIRDRAVAIGVQFLPQSRTQPNVQPVATTTDDNTYTGSTTAALLSLIHI